jgi:hypothetical protein
MAACDTINPVIGDISFGAPRSVDKIDREGRMYTDNDIDLEKERVSRHLGYAHALLSGTAVVDATKVIPRARILERLAEYAARLSFPTNSDDAPPPNSCEVPRLPVFIDRVTRVPCAVAHLMKTSDVQLTVFGLTVFGTRVLAAASLTTTATVSDPGLALFTMNGADLARFVDDNHHKAYATDIYESEPLVRAWASAVGLSAQDLAIIQPTYEHMRRRPIETKQSTTPSPTTMPVTPAPVVFSCDYCSKKNLQPPDHFRCTVCKDTDLCVSCYYLLRESGKGACATHKITHIASTADAIAIMEVTRKKKHEASDGARTN